MRKNWATHCKNLDNFYFHLSLRNSNTQIPGPPSPPSPPRLPGVFSLDAALFDMIGIDG